MEIKDLIEPANESLYQEVSARYSIRLEENKDWREEAWSSSVKGDAALITYCPVKFPEAAFARELLHISLHMKGYRPVLTGISLNPKVQEQLATLIKLLKHDFPHHKMANAFLEMGYSPDQFYPDHESPAFLQDALQESGRSLLSLSILYLIFTAPLTGFSVADTDKLQHAFDAYAGGKFQAVRRQVDELIHRWIQDEHHDAESHMIDLLALVGVTESWFSYEHDQPGLYEKRFPHCGFFVEKPFSLADINQLYK